MHRKTFFCHVYFSPLFQLQTRKTECFYKKLSVHFILLACQYNEIHDKKSFRDIFIRQSTVKAAMKDEIKNI